MLKIFNDLEPFFMDNYKRIGVREYARERKISPPSASTLLGSFHKESLLNKEEEKKYILYSANRENPLFIQISRAYWYIQIKKSGLIDHLNEKFVSPLIILFGSASKAEVKKDSDIDIALFTGNGKRINHIHTAIFENKLKRNLQILTFEERKIDNKELMNNILNGFILSGSW